MRYIIALLLVLGGCATGPTPEQRQAANDRYWDSLSNRCSQMGYAGDQHRGCIMQLHQIEEQRRAAIGAALIGSGILNQRPVQIQPIPQPTPIRPVPTLNTTCQWIGNQSYCSTR